MAHRYVSGYRSYVFCGIRHAEYEEIRTVGQLPTSFSQTLSEPPAIAAGGSGLREQFHHEDEINLDLCYWRGVREALKERPTFDPFIPEEFDQDHFNSEGL